MKDKTKAIISNVTCGLACLYLLLAYLIYVLPAVGPSVATFLQELGANFFLIPVAMVLGIIMLVGPILLILVIGVFIEAGMRKLLGLPAL